MRLWTFFTIWLDLSILCWSLSDLEYEVLSTLRDEINVYQDSVNTRLDAVDLRAETIHKQAAPETTVIGFTAVKTARQDVSSGDTISFERVISNFMEFYNPSTSRFTCPSHAVYYATASLERRRDVEVALYVDNLRQLSFKDTRRNDLTIEFNTVTNSMLVECDVGQQIWLEAVGNGEIYGDNDDNRRITTFTVFRLNDPFPGVDLPIPETYEPGTN